MNINGWVFALIIVIVLLISFIAGFMFGMASAFKIAAHEAAKFIDVDEELVYQYLDMYRGRVGWYMQEQGLKT